LGACLFWKNGLFNCAHLRSARPILAKKGRRPNAEHDPSNSKSPLIIDDVKVGGALTRREQPPEPEHIASDDCERMAKKGPLEPPSDKPTHRTWASRLGGTPILQKRPKIMNNNILKNCTHPGRQAQFGQKGTPTKREARPEPGLWT
jgi:hypothetical protein